MNIKYDPLLKKIRQNDSLSNAVEKLGTRFSFSDSQWNTQSIDGINWVKIGVEANVSVTFGSNKVSIADAGNVLVTNYLKYIPYASALKRWTMRAKYKCTSTLSGGTYGLCFGAHSVNTWGDLSLQFMLRCDTGAPGQGKIYFKHATTGSISSNAQLPVAKDDIIEMKVTYDQQCLNIRWDNLTQNASMTMFYRFDSNTSYPALNFSSFGFNSNGGAYEITEFEVTGNELKNLDCLFIGDSITNGTGTNVTKVGRDYVSIIADRFPAYRISRYSGGYDGAYYYAQTSPLAELAELRPKNAMILLGINDLSNSRTLDQLKADYGTLVTALKAVGTNVIHAGLVPNNNVDVRSFNLWLRQTYTSDVIIDIFAPLAASGVNTLSGGSYGINVSYSSDGLHPNDAGNLIMADVLTHELISNNILIPNNMLAQTV